MIGHGYVIGHGRMTFMDARVHLAVADYARDCLLRRAERGAPIDPRVIEFIKIADEIAAATSAYVSPVRNSAPTQEESSSEVDLPLAITARQAAEILDCSPHWARHLARQNGWIRQEVPIITMSRDAVLADKLRRDEENKCRTIPTQRSSA
jgi:hypothetical protein